ncbi:Ig-like domain-containing protein [Flavobacteriaceae bacterium]|nr:Ig-like domain-containing protein [Flavobacteriaceae bacterium]
MKKLIFFFCFLVIPNLNFSISNFLLNSAPTATPQSNVQAFEQTKVSITLSGTDPDDDSLTYILEKAPLNGRVTDPNNNDKTIFAGTIISTNKIDYISTSDSAASDFFEFKVFDGKLQSEAAKVSLSILLANDTPIANNQTVELTENTPTLITLTGSDPDKTIPTVFKIEKLPVTGTLTDPGNNDKQISAGDYLTGSKVTYTGQDTSTSDSFLFKVNDGIVESLVGTVSVVLIITDAPEANAQNVQVTEQVDYTIKLTGFDKEGDDLNFIINSLPSNGLLKNSGTVITLNDVPKNISGNNVVYTSTSDIATADSFTFRSNDGISSSFSAKVSISINPVNDKPLAADQLNVTAFEQIAKEISLVAEDPDGDELVYSVVDSPQNGNITINKNIATYISSSDTAKEDSFTFSANDNILNSEKATVTINIIQINDVPIAYSQNVSVVEDQSLEIILNGIDNDKDEFTFSITGNPINGEAALNDNKVIYKPKAGYFGSDSFIFEINDGTDSSDPASVTITITSNDFDEDGVLNKDDICPNTPLGSKVNAKGCRFFEMPANNYRIKVTSSSCINSNDGRIELTVVNSSYDYSVLLSGMSNPVIITGENKTANVTGLSKGDYTVCFKVTGQADYEQCFDITIGEPKALSAFVDVDSDNRTTTIQLGGSTDYNVNINGEMFKVTSDNFTSSLKTGLNIIKISTDLDCQGLIEREVFISEDIHYYPNPTHNDVRVHIGGEDSTVMVSVFSEKGSLIYRREQQVQDISRLTEIDLALQITGTYIIILEGPTVRKTFKVIKN